MLVLYTNFNHYESSLSGLERKEKRNPFYVQGYVLGNPATDIKIDRNSKVPFAHRMAFISDELYEVGHEFCCIMEFIGKKSYLILLSSL